MATEEARMDRADFKQRLTKDLDARGIEMVDALLYAIGHSLVWEVCFRGKAGQNLTAARPYKVARSPVGYDVPPGPDPFSEDIRRELVAAVLVLHRRQHTPSILAFPDETVASELEPGVLFAVKDGWDPAASSAAISRASAHLERLPHGPLRDPPACAGPERWWLFVRVPPGEVRSLGPIQVWLVDGESWRHGGVFGNRTWVLRHRMSLSNLRQIAQLVSELEGEPTVDGVAPATREELAWLRPVATASPTEGGADEDDGLAHDDPAAPHGRGPGGIAARPPLGPTPRIADDFADVVRGTAGIFGEDGDPSQLTGHVDALEQTHLADGYATEFCCDGCGRTMRYAVSYEELHDLSVATKAGAKEGHEVGSFERRGTNWCCTDDCSCGRGLRLEFDIQEPDAILDRARVLGHWSRD